jgi:hypothetical protein
MTGDSDSVLAVWEFPHTLAVGAMVEIVQDHREEPNLHAHQLSSTGDTITVQVIDGVAPLSPDAVLYVERRGPYEIARRRRGQAGGCCSRRRGRGGEGRRWRVIRFGRPASVGPDAPGSFRALRRLDLHGVQVPRADAVHAGVPDAEPPSDPGRGALVRRQVGGGRSSDGGARCVRAPSPSPLPS